MSEHMMEWKKNLQTVFSEYGKVIFMFLFVSTCLVSVYLITLLVLPGKLRISFLDVGQGDAILIQTPHGKDMLIDGGSTNVILSRLSDRMSYFDRNIDVVVATHPDADHVTGLIPVLEKYNVSNIVVSPSKGDTQVFSDLDSHINDEHAEVRIAQTGDVIDFHDGVIAHVLYPDKNYVAKKNDTNDSSVSVLITYGEQSFLLTGDLPIARENKLFSSGTLSKNITVYKAGHHGSKTSSGDQLLSYIRPEYAVISAGENNRYGHPHRETIERLQKYSKEIISTIDRGTISFVTDGRTLEVETSRR
jgi:beta-lactamase superfamily II metal-dependent hydrolase